MCWSFRCEKFHSTFFRLSKPDFIRYPFPFTSNQMSDLFTSSGLIDWLGDDVEPVYPTRYDLCLHSFHLVVKPPTQKGSMGLLHVSASEAIFTVRMIQSAYSVLPSRCLLQRVWRPFYPGPLRAYEFKTHHHWNTTPYSSIISVKGCFLYGQSHRHL